MTPYCQFRFRCIWHNKKEWHSYCSWIFGLIPWTLCIFGMWILDDLHVLGHGVFLLQYVSWMFPWWVSMAWKLKTITTMLFDFPIRVHAYYIDVWIELSLVLLIIYDFSESKSTTHYLLWINLCCIQTCFGSKSKTCTPL